MDPNDLPRRYTLEGRDEPINVDSNNFSGKYGQVKIVLANNSYKVTRHYIPGEVVEFEEDGKTLTARIKEFELFLPESGLFQSKPPESASTVEALV